MGNHFFSPPFSLSSEREGKDKWESYSVHFIYSKINPCVISDFNEILVHLVMLYVRQYIL
jgi:hypothetical protein